MKLTRSYRSPHRESRRDLDNYWNSHHASHLPPCMEGELCDTTHLTNPPIRPNLINSNKTPTNRQRRAPTANKSSMTSRRVRLLLKQRQYNVPSLFPVLPHSAHGCPFVGTGRQTKDPAPIRSGARSQPGAIQTIPLLSGQELGTPPPQLQLTLVLPPRTGGGCPLVGARVG